MEGAELSMFMISACICAVMLEHPDSPIRRAIASPFTRRAIMGALMGVTGIVLVYSPWGRQSGAHMNPALTFTFWRLGKVNPWDAVFYAIAQCAGGMGGVLVARLAVGPALAHPVVDYAVTAPGPCGALAAWVGESLIAFTMMSLILVSTHHPVLARFTGLLAGALAAIHITVEAPWSGTSMNPARTLGSAIFANQWTGFWIYLTAPLAGMTCASVVYAKALGRHAVHCAKLNHANRYRCIFCEYQQQKSNAPMPPAEAVLLEALASP